jgi:phosphoserine phosphatase
MGEIKHIPIFLDVDLTVTEEYQQIPLLLEHEKEIRKKVEEAGLEYSGPRSYFSIQDQMGGNPGVNYLNLFIWEAQKGRIFEGLTNKDLKKYGKKVKPAKGIREGFHKLKQDFEDKNTRLHFFLISVGIKPMIEGFVEANGLDDVIEGIAASEFSTDKKGVINGLNEVTTSFGKNAPIISFIKGDAKLLDITLFPGQYKFDYKDMIVAGDGYSDISMFSFAKKKGGTPVAVYKPGSYKEYKKTADSVGVWVDYVLPRDYSPGFITFNLLSEIIESKLSRSCDFRASSLYDYKKGKVRHPNELACIEKHLKECQECNTFYRKTFVTPEGTKEVHNIAVELYNDSKHKAH